MKTFKYKKNSIYLQALRVAIICILLVLILTNFNFNFNFFNLIFIVILLSILPIALIYRTILLEIYQISNDGIIIQHLFKKEHVIPFNQIKSIIIKERDNYLFTMANSENLITIYVKQGKNKRIFSSYLRNEHAFIKSINTQANTFKVVHQKLDNIIRFS